MLQQRTDETEEKTIDGYSDCNKAMVEKEDKKPLRCMVARLQQSEHEQKILGILSMIN